MHLHPDHQPQHEGTFVEVKNRAKTDRKKITVGFLAGVAAIGWLYAIFFSDIFTVQRFEIQGISQLGRGEVEKEAREVLQNQRKWPFHAGNIFFIQKEEVGKTLQDHLFAESVDVDKLYPNVLRLIVKERRTSLILVASGRMYEIDKNGVATREISSAQERSAILATTDQPTASGSAEPILHIAQTPDISVSNQFVAPEVMQGWLDAFQTFSKRRFGYRSASMEMVSSTKLTMQMYEPFQVYFDLGDSLNQQIDSYYAFTKAHGSVKDIHEYVDARIPGRLFYK